MPSLHRIDLPPFLSTIMVR